MGLATQLSVVQFSGNRKRISELNSMSQDYRQAGIFNFSNGFERSAPQPPPHVAQQIRRDKLRVQGYDPPPSLVGLEDDESTSASGLPVAYEAAGMLSEMFNFPSGGPTTATELPESQILSSYRRHQQPLPHLAADWLPHRQMMVGADLIVPKNQTAGTSHHQISSMNSDSAAAAMHFFFMNPHHQQRSPSPSTSNPPPLTQPASSTLHMLLPNQSVPPGGGFGNFAWVKDNPSHIPGVVEGQGLSLSLSSSLQQMEADKAEEWRMGENNMLFFCQGGGVGPAAPPQYQLRNLGGGQTQVGQGFSPPSSSYGALNLLRNSKYAKAAQELLEEFCSVGRGQSKKNSFRRGNNNDGGNPSSAGDGNSSSSSKDQNPPLSASDRHEHQRRKAKLLSMLDEVDRRYNHYCEQMQVVVNSFDMVMGFGSAAPYTSLAQKAMSRHFRVLKDAITAQLKHSWAALGEKDAASSGVTKGETPRLRILEQSLRQQRAFQQMGMMEQEAWRPQRGLPERSVNILRAWLFEHFLHPYPSDADKHLLARQTGLSRNQVSNWFINARVRLWKPMVEEMYQQEAKDEDEIANDDANNNNNNQRDQISCATAQNPTLYDSSAPTIAGVTPLPAAGERPDAVDCQENQRPFSGVITQGHVFYSAVAPTAGHSLPESNSDDIEGTLIRFGAGAAGDVSLTLGLRHAGNFPEKGHFSVRDYRGR